MRMKIKYLEKPAGLGILGLKGAAQLNALYVGKQFDSYVLNKIEMDENGVVYFYRADKDGKPAKVSISINGGEHVVEAEAACIHASKLGSFLLDDDTGEQPARQNNQQGNQRR